MKKWGAVFIKVSGIKISGLGYIERAAVFERTRRTVSRISMSYLI